MGLGKFLSILGASVPTAGVMGAPHVDVASQVVATPDHPIGFGDAIQWFAAANAETRSVASALSLATPLPANWGTGLMAVQTQAAEDSWVFVSPPVAGWVFIIGNGFGGPDDRAVRTALEQRQAQSFDRHFTALYGRFPDVQFFSSRRDRRDLVWARAASGRVARIFAAREGKLLANIGQQTAEESVLKLPNISGLSLPAAEQALATQRGRRVVDADAVLAVAGAWGMNPAQLERGMFDAGAGLVARLV